MKEQQRDFLCWCWSQDLINAKHVLDSELHPCPPFKVSWIPRGRIPKVSLGRQNGSPRSGNAWVVETFFVRPELATGKMERSRSITRKETRTGKEITAYIALLYILGYIIILLGISYVHSLKAGNTNEVLSRLSKLEGGGSLASTLNFCLPRKNKSVSKEKKI